MARDLSRQQLFFPKVPPFSLSREVERRGGRCSTATRVYFYLNVSPFLLFRAWPKGAHFVPLPLRWPVSTRLWINSLAFFRRAAANIRARASLPVFYSLFLAPLCLSSFLLPGRRTYRLYTPRDGYTGALKKCPGRFLTPSRSCLRALLLRTLAPPSSDINRFSVSFQGAFFPINQSWCLPLRGQVHGTRGTGYSRDTLGISRDTRVPREIIEAGVITTRCSIRFYPTFRIIYDTSSRRVIKPVAICVDRGRRRRM